MNLTMSNLTVTGLFGIAGVASLSLFLVHLERAEPIGAIFWGTMTGAFAWAGYCVWGER